MKMHRSSEHIQNAQCWSGMLGKQSWGNIVDIQSLLAGCSTHAESDWFWMHFASFMNLSGRILQFALLTVRRILSLPRIDWQKFRGVESVFSVSSKCCLPVYVEEEVQHPQQLVLDKTSQRSKQQTQAVFSQVHMSCDTCGLSRQKAAEQCVDMESTLSAILRSHHIEYSFPTTGYEPK